MAPERSVDGASVTDARRTLPSVEAVRAAIAATHHDSTLPSAVAVDIARTVIDAARRAAELGADVRPDAVLADAIAQARRWSERLLGPVHNATGVLLHTNLGRAPLAADTLDAVAAAGGAVNLEYDMDAGRRGSRHDHAGHLLALAVGAEAGIVVNNNAAAVLLVLAALARGREVVVSRGELVEIGGGFRVPASMAASKQFDGL